MNRVKSLWSRWASVRWRLEGADRIALFLDYDGTLSPIARHPSQARIPGRVKRLLSDLARRPDLWIALISGRGLADLKRRVGLKRLCYVGSHGMEVQGPGIAYIHPAARRCRPLLKRIARQLGEVVRPIPGAWVEDKRFAVAVHSRQVAPTAKPLIRKAFREVVRPYRLQGRVRVTAGKEIFEVRPPVGWTKGTVTRWLLRRRQALCPGAEILPLYIGDDLTDEDAFGALRGRGITIAVGPATQRSRAEYAVSSPAQVRRFLERLSRLLRARPAGACLR